MSQIANGRIVMMVVSLLFVVIYLEAFILASATTIVLGKLDDDSASIDHLAIQFLHSLFRITGILWSTEIGGARYNRENWFNIQS